jgi:hypothetical protein
MRAPDATSTNCPASPNTSTHANSADLVQVDDGAGRQADVTLEVQRRPLRQDGVGRLLVLATEDVVRLGLSIEGRCIHAGQDILCLSIHVLLTTALILTVRRGDVNDGPVCKCTKLLSGSHGKRKNIRCL